jgi:hypothetical protein
MQRRIWRGRFLRRRTEISKPACKAGHQSNLPNLQGHDESRDAIDKECVSLVKALGQGGWLKPRHCRQSAMVAHPKSLTPASFVCCAKNWPGTMA